LNNPPDLELLGQQLPAGQAAPSVRRAVLELRHHPHGGEAARRLRRPGTGEPARQTGRHHRPGRARGPVECRRRLVRRRGHRRPPDPVAELLPQHAAAWRRQPVRAVQQRAHRRPGQPARQPQSQLPGEQEQSRRRAGMAHGGSGPPGQLVAGLRRLAGRARRRAEAGTRTARRRRLTPLVDAPGTYVFDR